MLLPYLQEGRTEAGCDEAGRGCLAGPVFAAAVILPPDFRSEELNDSKQLSEKQRDKLRIVIENEALSWAVGVVSAPEIDKLNILRASITAMHRAIEQLTIRPEHLLIDGNKFVKYTDIQHTTVVKGDGKYLSIAAASVLAKTHRDEYMQQLSLQYPEYKWNINKGYPTQEHRDAIRKYGVTPEHRKSFVLLPPAQLSLEF
ncbi:MAG: ribonuclease HII [Tannerella sp.]|jgi:ribonuclease HII|nr:ribonuclease HII [Tannerella sp.]